MFPRLLIGSAALGAFLAAAPAVIVFTLFDFFGRHPMPVTAQLLAIAGTVVGAAVAYGCLAPIVSRLPKRIIIEIR